MDAGNSLDLVWNDSVANDANITYADIAITDVPNPRKLTLSSQVIHPHLYQL
jgi:hypothetical protein